MFLLEKILSKEKFRLKKQNLDIGLKFLFSKKNLQLTINGYDIFYTNRATSTNNYPNNIKKEINNYYDFRRIALTLSYKFGNKNINVQKKSFGNEEEQNRAK